MPFPRTLGLYLIFVFFNPYAPSSMTPAVAAMMLLAIVGMIVSLAAKSYMMLVSFVMLFVPVGFYLLGTPGIFRWIGILNLLLLVSSLILLVADWRGRLQRSLRREER